MTRQYTLEVVVSERDDLDPMESKGDLPMFIWSLLTRGSFIDVHSVRFVKEKDTDVIGHFLAANGYQDIEEWAIHVGHHFNDDTDTWYNDEGKPIDLEEALTKTLEGAIE